MKQSWSRCIDCVCFLIVASKPCLVLLQGLTGKLPAMGKDTASKMSVIRMTNTSLQQCDATHLAVYKDGLRDTSVDAGSNVIGTDNSTDCLPDALLFCEEEQVGGSALYCPSLAFRRPVQSPVNQLALVSPTMAFLFCPALPMPCPALPCPVCMQEATKQSQPLLVGQYQ